jgi:hypothetical protein
MFSSIVRSPVPYGMLFLVTLGCHGLCLSRCGFVCLLVVGGSLLECGRVEDSFTSPYVEPVEGKK